MTYRELLKQLMELPDTVLDFDATVYDIALNEFCVITALVTEWNHDTYSANDRVDNKTPLLEF